MTAWDFGKIEATFAAAATDPALWQSALQLVSDQTGSRGALFLPLLGNRLPGVPASDGAARATEIYFRDGWHARDLRYAASSSALRGNVIDDLDFITPDQIKRHAYYQEFLAPAGLRWFAGVPLGSADQLWCLSIQRGVEQMPFSEEEKGYLLRLSKSLSASVALAQALGFAASSAALEAFEISQTAVVLLNRNAEVVRTNRAADRLLVGDISICQRRVTSIDKAASDALNCALRHLLWNASDASLMPPVALPRTGQRPVLAYPVKMSRLSYNFLSECQAAVVLVDTEAKTRSPEAALRNAFGLTAAEARLAALLASGDTLELACDKLAIAKETGRNQLKSIFARTGTRRQAELVLMMAGLL